MVIIIYICILIQMIEVSKELKNKYDNHYSDELEKWREIGAIGKANNIIDVSNNKKFNNIIEVGAGDGNLTLELSKRGFGEKLTCAEISDSAIKQIKKKNIDRLIEIKRIDGYSLPFEDNQFDLAICSHVLEHVEFPRQLLRELIRVSKEQILEVPIDFSFSIHKKFKHFNDYGHINIYTPSLFNFLLQTEKLEIINDKCALYRKEVGDFQFKDNYTKRLKINFKRFVWKLFPKLMRMKPNTYTVYTR